MDLGYLVGYLNQIVPQIMDNISRALTDAKVRNAKAKETPYKLTDGAGLHLLVKENGTRLWRFKFRLHGKEGLLSIGAYPDVSLSAAREEHRSARALVAAGINPVHARKEERERGARERRLADKGEFMAVLQDWREVSDKGLAEATLRQRSREIAKYIEPEFKGRNIAGITRGDLADLLNKIEKRAPEVARNLRSYLNGIFEHAIGLEMLSANPMPPAKAKRGPQSRKRNQRHHAAMDMVRLPAFLKALDGSNANPETKAAMRLLLLTACRKAEVTGARWEEFDLDKAEWVIPASRMKAREEHFVPLSAQAVALLRELRKLSKGVFLFPHRDKPRHPMAANTLNAAMVRIGYGETATPHGFRSTFSTFFNAQPGVNPDVVERVLAHTPKDGVRAAYNRHEYKVERGVMLQEWADHIDKIVTDN